MKKFYRVIFQNVSLYTLPGPIECPGLSPFSPWTENQGFRHFVLCALPVRASEFGTGGRGDGGEKEETTTGVCSLLLGISASSMAEKVPSSPEF